MSNKVFLAGAGREIITPAVGTLLFGYNPNTVSTSVNDDLTITAVALESDGQRAMLLCATICEIDTGVANAIRTKIAAETGVPFENITYSATHTHSGPVTVYMSGWGDINRDYCDNILLPKSVAAAKAAVNSLKPAKLGVGTTHSEVGINRRELTPDGQILLGQNPWGMYDPEMTVISLRGLDGSPIVNIIHYCCHGTAAGCNHEISRDWSGPMIDQLERQSGCMSVFFNGACGDIGPRLSNGHTTGDISDVRELGAKAALDAVRAYRTIKEYREDVPFRLISDDISLPYKPLPSEAAIDNALAAYAGRNTDNLINIERLEYDKLVRVKEELNSGREPKTAFTFKQTLIAFGPVLIIPFPFEIFVEITIRLRSASKFQYTLCLSNTNGANAYFPSQDQICRGGYEIRTFTAGGTYNLADDSDTRIICANLELINKM